MIVYDCRKFIEKTTKEHKGLIGTSMRYYPLFSEEYSKVKQIIIMDVDVGMESITNLKNYINFVKKNPSIQFFFKSSGFNHINEWANDCLPQVMSSNIVSNRQYPMKIF